MLTVKKKVNNKQKKFVKQMKCNILQISLSLVTLLFSIFSFLLSNYYSISLNKESVKIINKERSKLISSINYNKCVNNYIPKVSGMLETAEYLWLTNKSIIRYDDDDILYIINNNIRRDNEERGTVKRLKEILNNSYENIIIAIPNIFTSKLYQVKDNYDYWNKHFYMKDWILDNYKKNNQYFDSHISSPYIFTYNTSCELVPLLYENLRRIWMNRDIVIVIDEDKEKEFNTYKFNIFDNVKSQKIILAPSSNSWREYEELTELLMEEDFNKFFIFNTRTISKISAYDIAMSGRRSLDLGDIAKDYNTFMRDNNHKK